MGSGSFPLSREFDIGDGQKLLRAAKTIEEVLRGWYEDVSTGESGGMQFDNAAMDGGYLHRLELAVQLVRECVEPVD